MVGTFFEPSYCATQVPMKLRYLVERLDLIHGNGILASVPILSLRFFFQNQSLIGSFVSSECWTSTFFKFFYFFLIVHYLLSLRLHAIMQLGEHLFHEQKKNS